MTRPEIRANGNGLDHRSPAWKRRVAVAMNRYMRWGRRRFPPGVRTVLGVLLCIGGVLGFLPVLGFWMFPLGLALLALDFPPLERMLQRWMRGIRKR